MAGGLLLFFSFFWGRGEEPTDALSLTLPLAIKPNLGAWGGNSSRGGNPMDGLKGSWKLWRRAYVIDLQHAECVRLNDTLPWPMELEKPSRSSSREVRIGVPTCFCSLS